MKSIISGLRQRAALIVGIAAALHLLAAPAMAQRVELPITEMCFGVE